MSAGRISKRGLAERLFATCGEWLIGLGCYFISIRPALLPEDLRYMGIDAQVLQSMAPGLARWLSKVFTVMGGFMAGAGVLVAYWTFGGCCWRPHRRGQGPLWPTSEKAERGSPGLLALEPTR